MSALTDRMNQELAIAMARHGLAVREREGARYAIAKWRMLGNRPDDVDESSYMVGRYNPVKNRWEEFCNVSRFGLTYMPALVEIAGKLATETAPWTEVLLPRNLTDG